MPVYSITKPNDMTMRVEGTVEVQENGTLLVKRHDKGPLVISAAGWMAVEKIADRSLVYEDDGVDTWGE